MVNIC